MRDSNRAMADALLQLGRFSGGLAARMTRSG